jgi:hypothetical protein
VSLQEAPQFTLEGGANSAVNPENLNEVSYVMGMNVVSRGGIAQTRPGQNSLFNMPCGPIQGLTSFTPNNGPEHLVAAVNGSIYVSAAPFKNYYQLNGIQFDPLAKFVAWAQCVQSFDYDDAGNLIPIEPRSILVMQDGLSRAAFWDGGTARHLDPTPSTVTGDDGNIIFQPNLNETPQGLWMEWAGNRLWVTRGKQVFASDYGNPLKFTEQLYLAEGRAFYMPENVTGIIQPSFGTELIVFGYNSITFIKANILERSQWLNTPDFQRTETGVGCVSHRSIVKKNGLVWWYAPSGVINLNAALQFFNDSRLYYYDGPMMESKANISGFMERICSSEIEDYLMFSVPSGDAYNRHTWIADLFQGQFRWDGYWTGTRPVEWTTITIAGVERTFHISRDFDDVNRIWESFQPNKTDNGEPITSWLRTRAFNFGNRLNKRYHHSEFYFDNILGTTDVAIFTGGTRGGFTRAYTKRIEAEDGPIDSVTPWPAGTDFFDNVSQSRTEKTQNINWTTADACYTCQVESPLTRGTDRAFSHLIIWSGQLGILGFKLYATLDANNPADGECPKDEEAPRAVNAYGCAATDTFAATKALTLYEATESVTVTCPQNIGKSITVVSTSNSYISEQDAERKALGSARKLAQSILNCSEVILLTTEDEQIITTEDEIPLQV